MINIQKSFSVLFNPLWFYSVQIGPIRSILSTSVLFGRYWSSSVHYGPICSYSVHYVHFGPNMSIRSFLVHIAPLCPIQSTSILFGHILFIQFTLFHLVYLCLLRSIRTTSIYFDPLQSILCILYIGKRHVWVQSTYSKSKFILKI